MIHVCTKQIRVPNPENKWCYGCQSEKPRTMFSPDKKGRDGHRSRCKGCSAEYRSDLLRANPQYRESQKLKRKERRTAVVRPCKTCGAPLPLPHVRGNKRYCSIDCRPGIPMGRGHSQTFRIGLMTPAEFAFSEIMKQRGVFLAFIGLPCRRMFKLDGTSYTPDFKDEKTGEYYEVCGTRQAFNANKGKYLLFRATYPHLTLNIVKPDGSPCIGFTGPGKSKSTVSLAPNSAQLSWVRSMEHRLY